MSKGWSYKGEEIKDIEQTPSGSVGFIYKITHLPSGKQYIGRKSFWHTHKRKIGKREKAKIKKERRAKGIGGRLPKYKYVKVDSKWLEYYGSNKQIAKLAKENLQREILQYGYSKKNLNYLETKELFSRGVIESDKYFNENIQGKYFKKDAMVSGSRG